MVHERYMVNWLRHYTSILNANRIITLQVFLFTLFAADANIDDEDKFWTFHWVRDKRLELLGLAAYEIPQDDDEETEL